MRVTISQPRYIPALNYLQRICLSDVFVVFDIVQRQGRAFENRNRLLLPEPRWLTIPIGSSSRAAIKDALIDGDEWIAQHRALIAANYRQTPCFDDELLDGYLSAFSAREADAPRHFSYAAVLGLERILDALALPHNFKFASRFCGDDVEAAEGPLKLRLICEQLGADEYISGENGRSYGVSECFAGSRCKVFYHGHENAVYEQQGNCGEFVPWMGFLDALFNKGRNWVRDVLLSQPRLLP